MRWTEWSLNANYMDEGDYVADIVYHEKFYTLEISATSDHALPWAVELRVSPLTWDESLIEDPSESVTESLFATKAAAIDAWASMMERLPELLMTQLL